MTGSRLIGLVVAVLALGGIAYFAFPGFRAKVDEWKDKNAGWTDEARRKDPVGFIDYSIKKLQENIDKFGSYRTDLMQAKGNLEELRRTNQEKLAFTEKNLGEFKTAYREATTGGKGWPVTMAGRAYSENELKQQVELLLSTKTGYENTVTQVDEALKRADSKSNDLTARMNESKGKLDILKSQRELVKINQLDSQTEKMLAEVNKVIIENDAAQTASPVRTPEELMRDAKFSAKATPKADDFLKS